MTGILHYATFLAILLSLSNMHSQFLQVYLTNGSWKFLLLNMHVDIWCCSVWEFSHSPGGRVLSPSCFNLHICNDIGHSTVLCAYFPFVCILCWHIFSDYLAHLIFGFLFSHDWICRVLWLSHSFGVWWSKSKMYTRLVPAEGCEGRMRSRLSPCFVGGCLHSVYVHMVIPLLTARCPNFPFL